MSKEYTEDIENDNDEIIEDIAPFETSSIVVYSRDWTIETMFSQIISKNIDLNPKYQRRNAWNDDKRSKLIESIIIGYPIPEIVLAENPLQKKSFAVIDGKQRLLTIAGFINPEEFGYWDNGGKLIKLTVLKNLVGYSYNDIKSNEKLSNEFREFLNAALRCTIITNFQANDVLYDIFYRLNSGSVSLSTQELRQVLNRGEFADFLIETTNSIQPLHLVMNLSEPDKRLRDIEVLLRCLSMIEFSNTYSGNLKQFLDGTMAIMTKEWESYKTKVATIYHLINDSIELLKDIFGDYRFVGRKFTNDKPESRFNRVILEAQLFFFTRLPKELINENTIDKFKIGFINLCQNDSEFRSSVESSTKNIDSYRVRFQKLQHLMNESFGSNLNINPF
ncbi:hypothetical protein ADIS_1941 [Lunatimonas lonarensis]|uniref:GmrSD restriction endonucleases N-terminal domain-containing protein n=1 Tax=Lunatimonas lonarensis TaxID=1232681 RepID=R7ZU15_9BACT|nr:DUF262 domain-containing protein [Lunatimonas lonarensis]EON77538.1 hypothetical protein ADIS_1941 [Lunatimonas lonarensis]